MEKRVTAIDIKEMNNFFLPQKRIQEILHLVKNNVVHSLVVRLMFATGIYTSELINIRVSDLDTEGMTLNIFSSQKLNSRKINISKNLFLDLLRHGQSIHTNGYLFQGRDGKICDRTVQKMFSKINRKLGENFLNLERIRNSLSVHLLILGYSVHEVGFFLGHKDIRSTRKRIQKFLANDSTRLDLFKTIFTKYA
jgi:integrase